MIISSTMVQTVLSWAIVALTIATVVLAVDKAKINAELTDVENKLDYLESELEGAVKPRSIRAADEDINYRLPKSLIPTHYDLYLHPDIDTGTFKGHVLIQVTVVEQTSQIILHVNKLNVESVKVAASSGNVLDVNNFEIDEVREFLVITMLSALEENEVIDVEIVFSGKMLDKIVGLYSSTYLTPEGERKGIATTKFEPTFARQAFPCFDEPAMKASFTITLVRPNEGGYHALSNMDEADSVQVGDNTEVRFEKSVPMSTYLACVIVSDFAHNTKPINTHGIGNNFEIRIFATSHQLSKVDFALEIAVAVTEFYIQYFEVEYPLPKLDMAAIPDFVSNAMEHWGLLTYRETALLYDRSFSSTWNKQSTAAVVAHELAHMWFGDLVTMMWWNDLWLNEGFARYMQYKSVHEVKPDWGLLDQFLVHALHKVMKYDSSVASHPIVQTVENPDQITEIFDTISYEKGASVIRMLENFVGADKFKQAVSNYLTKFKYQNAVTDDFIKEVANMGFDFDVPLIMSTWTVQMGLPVVQVQRISATQYRLTQKRFFSNIEDYEMIYDDSEFNYTWTIPITYQTNENNQVHFQWFDYDVSSILIDVPDTTKWIKVNNRQVGYYRVNYEEQGWKDIISELIIRPESFSIADRAHLLNDVFALADASQLSYDIALDITRYLSKEMDFVPWYVATTKLEDLHRILMHSDIYMEYLTYARALIAPAYREVTWTVDDDDHLRNRLRVTILTTACALGLPDCLAEASVRFNAWLEAPANKPDPDLREIIYYYGMQHVGNQNIWEQMWELFLAEQDASEKTKLMFGLSAIRTPWLLHRFVELAADETNIRRQDYFNCLQNIAENPAGEAVVWDYVRENWPNLVDRFGLNERYMGRMIPAITAHFSSETKMEEMQNFFAKYPNAGAGTAARKQALETVKYNIKWLEENKSNVGDWLNINSEN